MGSDGKPPSTRGSVAKLIENLACLATIDVMLMEGTPASDVAKFIQRDQGELTDIHEPTLANALMARLRQRQEVGGWWSGGNAIQPEEKPAMGIVSGGYRRAAQTPKTFLKALYEKSQGGVQELLEMEALYLSQRDRVDRIMELEAEVGAFSEKTGQEILIAAKIAEMRFAIAKELGLIEGGDAFKYSVDIKGYSARTAEVMNNPESRHRVISIVERIAQNARRAEAASDEAPISLPPPKSSSGK